MIRLIRRSAEFIAADRHAMAGLILLALVVSVFGVVEPLVTKHLFDALGQPGAMRSFAYGIGALLLLEVSRAMLGGWLSVLTWKVRLRVDFRLRERLFSRLCTLPLSYHRSQAVGGTVNRVNQGIAGFLNTFVEVALHILPSVVFLTLAVFAMVRLDWRLSLAVLVFAPLPTLIGAWAAREQARRERVLLETWTKLYARLNEVLAGILTVKGFAREQAEVEHFLARQASGNEVVQAGVRRDTLTSGARNFAATLARITALALGGYYVSRGEITVGTLVAFQGYIGGLFGPVQGLTGVYQTLRRGLVALEVIYDILDADDTVADRPGAREAPRFVGHVVFQDVGFSYPDGTKVLERFDLEVAPGETIAFVGPSGAGKTTLVHLLQRQYEVTAGRILVDGADLGSFTAGSLRRQVGVVFQDVHLFDESVHANIAYGRPGASRAEVMAAARAAQAHAFIEALPDGYDTVVGERGSRLSGGQKQRVAIARALLTDPPILILDEATSALDAESEALVQQALRTLLRGRTTFVIAHRLSTVTEADRIVVLREGRIEAIGTHAELLREGGYYADLVRMQADGVLREPALFELAA